MLYPDITRIRDVSVTVARQVIRQSQKQKLDREKSIRGMSDAQLDAWIRERMYDPASTKIHDAQGSASKLWGGSYFWGFQVRLDCITMGKFSGEKVV